MAVICPTVTAFGPHEYREQMERLEPFAERIHIDLMDGEFAPTESPGLDQVWWPEQITADIHLMYRRPMEEIEPLIKLKPSLVIIHYEAEVDHAGFAAKLHENGIKTGLAILRETRAEDALPALADYDHVLIFSGDLGKHGGIADLGILAKVGPIRQKYPAIEISWDGGINDQNANQLIDGGIDVLNVGGFIQNADDPESAYKTLLSPIV